VPFEETRPRGLTVPRFPNAIVSFQGSQEGWQGARRRTSPFPSVPRSLSLAELSRRRRLDMDARISVLTLPLPLPPPTFPLYACAPSFRRLCHPDDDDDRTTSPPLSSARPRRLSSRPPRRRVGHHSSLSPLDFALATAPAGHAGVVMTLYAQPDGRGQGAHQFLPRPPADPPFLRPCQQLSRVALPAAVSRSPSLPLPSLTVTLEGRHR